MKRPEKLDGRHVFLSLVLVIAFAQGATGQMAGATSPAVPAVYSFGGGVFSGADGGNFNFDLGDVNSFFRPDSTGPNHSESKTDYVLDSTQALGWKRGDRIGVFSPTQSLYFSAEMRGFSIEYRETDRKYFVSAHFKPLSPEAILERGSEWADDDLIIWKPRGKMTPAVKEFDPSVFTGAYWFERPNKASLGESIKDQMNVELKETGLEAIPQLFQLELKETIAADTFDRFVFQRVLAPFVTTTAYGFHDIILFAPSKSSKRLHDKSQIAAALTNRAEVSTLADTSHHGSFYDPGIKSFIIHGIVDLNFDGSYELVVTEMDNHGSAYDSTTYVLGIRKGIPARIGPIKSRSGD